MAKQNKKWRYLLGAVPVLAVTAFVLVVFNLLGSTDQEPVYLFPKPQNRQGWQCETLPVNGTAAPAALTFRDEYRSYLPGEAVRAVRLRRTLTETLPLASIRLSTTGAGIELFLDDEPLYSDFAAGPRDAAGFAVPDEATLDRLRDNMRTVAVTLPEDYTGRVLSVLLYYPDPRTDPELEYPVLYNEETLYAPHVVYSVDGVAVTTFCAMLALLVTALVFWVDLPGPRPHYRNLLLALYFLLLFTDKASNSMPGALGLLRDRLNLEFLSGLYMAVMCLYLALTLHGRKRWVLCAATVGGALYSAVRMYRELRECGMVLHPAARGIGSLVMLFAMAAALLSEHWGHWRRAGDKKRIRFYAAAAAAVILARIWYGAREFDGHVGRYVGELLYALRSGGNTGPLMSLVMDVSAAMAVLALVVELVRSTLRTRQTVSVLHERSRLTLESYEHLLKAEEATNALHHEMRHHMTALAGILETGDTARARDYVASVNTALDSLPTARYSPNILINAIAGNYLDQAKAEGITVEHSLKVPAQLPIADEDISVFTANMLENALQACRRIPSGQPRYIRVKMAVKNDFLFLSCANSAPEEQETEKTHVLVTEPRRHGYGLEAMRQIAEKYDSVLLIRRGGGEFSVKSNLSLSAQAAGAVPAGG